VEVIPNGVEIPEDLPEREWLPGNKLRLLYLGRLHPKKGIEKLLEAIAILQDETVSLALYGAGDDHYVRNLKSIVRSLGLEQAVTFRGHINGQAKLDAFMRADVCVLPSFTENFGVVVGEALAHAVPVIASHGTPWEGLEIRRCGLWIDNSPEGLADAIRRIRQLDLKEMGMRGRDWIRNEFSWDAIAATMLRIYSDLSMRGNLYCYKGEVASERR
jgi:glycosyltransferase involved in cell wall biosynthesis